MQNYIFLCKMRKDYTSFGDRRNFFISVWHGGKIGLFYCKPGTNVCNLYSICHLPFSYFCSVKTNVWIYGT